MAAGYGGDIAIATVSDLYDLTTTSTDVIEDTKQLYKITDGDYNYWDNK